MVGNQMAATGTEGRQKGCDIVFGIVEGVEVVGDVVGSIVVVRAVVGDKVVEVVTVVVGKGGSQNSVSKFCTFCCEVRCCLTQHNVTASLRACLQYRSVFKTSHG